MALNFGSIFKKVRDVFDANTEEDQRKRMAQGQARLYGDQQRQMGNNQVNNNIVGQVGRPIYNTANKVYNTVAPGAKLLSNTLTRQNVFDTNKSAMNNQLNQSFGAGVINNKSDSTLAGNIKQTVDFGARAASTGSELAPYFVTGPGGKMVLQQGARALPKIAGFNAAQSAIGSAGTQLNQTGKIDSQQLLTDTALGTAIGTGGSALFAGASRLLSKGAKVPPLDADGLISQPGSKVRVDPETGKKVFAPEYNPGTKAVNDSGLQADNYKRDIGGKFSKKQVSSEGTTRVISEREFLELNKTDQLPANRDGYTNLIKPGKLKDIRGIPDSKKYLVTFKDGIKIDSDGGPQYAVKGGISRNQIDNIEPYVKSENRPPVLAKKYNNSMYGEGSIGNDVPESFLKPKTESDKAMKSMIDEAADALDSFKKQTGGTGTLRADDGTVLRTTSNPQWYRDFYETNKRAPNKSEMRQMAYDMLERGDKQLEGMGIDTALYKATKEMAGEAPKPKVTAKSSGGGGTLRPDKTPNPDANPAQQGVLSNERAASVQNSVDEMKAFMKSGESTYDQAKPKVTAKTGETRGFEKNMTKANVVDQNPTAQAVIEAMPGYTPITNKATMKAASQEVLADPTAALDDVLTKPQLDNAKDVMKSNVLLKQAVEDGDTETAIQLGTKLGMDGTQLGQAIQAYSTWKKTTPEGVIKFATKEALKSGKPLQKELAESLVTQARALADMPEGVEKAVAARSMLNDVAQANRTWRDVLSEIINMPRAAMATADLSAPLRQGAVLGARNPKEFARGFVDQIKYFGSKNSYEKAMYEISQRPSYELMKQSKLAVSAADQLSGTEEQFMSNFLESDALKKLGVGHVVAGSDRAYSGFLTKLRADVFDKIVTKSKDAGVELDDKALKSLATYINSASGRGNLGGLERHAGLLSQALFSPRLWKSRIDVLNPVYYARLDPVARKYALETTASFAAVVSTVLGLAALGGAEVGTDPRSADFAKIKVGNTRYDIMGGLQQNIRLAAQMITGEKIDSSTGLVQTLGPERGFGKPSRYDLLTQFIENKENPVIGYATKMLKGTDPTGEAYKPVEELAKLFIPLTIQGTYETIKDQNSVAKGVAMNVPGLFGVGTQTYDSQIDQEKRSKELVSREKKDFQKQGGGGKELSDGKYYTKVGDEYKTFDSKEKADIATFKEDFKKSDKKSAVSGDTYFYKDKSGEVKTKPKVLYEWEQTDAKANLKMDRAYEAGDLGAWAEAATAKYDGLEKKKALYDPQTEQDEIDKITLAQENLQQKAEKYAAKGIGGSSGSKGRKATAVDARKYGVSLRQGGKIAVGKVSAPKVSTKAPTRKTATAKPKVSIKKSLV